VVVELAAWKEPQAVEMTDVQRAECWDSEWAENWVAQRDQVTVASLGYVLVEQWDGYSVSAKVSN
jgi:hypothetical protein